MKRKSSKSTELTKLQALFATIPENKKKLCEKLIQNAAFMAETLEELQATVKKEGAVVTIVNGNGFEVQQENPAQKSYNTMINRYSTIIRQLSDMLPVESECDELGDLIG